MTAPALAVLTLLGAYHGVNPAMGWLFAVALGLQEGSRRVVLRALPPIALGHGLSVAIVAALAGSARVAVDPGPLRVLGATILIAFGAWKLIRRSHPRWTGMRVTRRDLVVWSFLMSTAHGAPLMLVPVMLGPHAGGHEHGVLAAASLAEAAAATLVHTASMFLVMAGTALLVYDRLGVGILRRAWFNTDAAWAITIVVAGLFTLL